jgi:hypothetical protein
MRRYTCVSLFVGLCLSVVTGCSSEKKYSDEDYDDVATAVGALVGTDSTGETASMEDAEEISTGNADSDLAQMGGDSWQGNRAGLTYSYDVACKDAEGQAQESCNESTDSANMVLAWNGHLDLPRYDASVDRTGDWTLSGLQSDTAVFNGKGTFDVETEFTAWFRPVTRNFELDYDASYDNVTFDRIARQFTSGTIHYAVNALRTVTHEGERSETAIDVAVDIEFIGNGQARINVDGVRDYDLDLSSGQVVGEDTSDNM